MTVSEIPSEKDRRGHYRWFEILPGALSYGMLLLPVVLSVINVTVAAIFILVYLLINFVRGIAGAIRALHGYHVMRTHQALPWRHMLQELESGQVDPHVKRPKWHIDAIVRSSGEQPERALLMPPSQVIHAVIVATYKESRAILEPTIQSVLDSDFSAREQVIFVLAYEQRGGPDTAKLAASLVNKYQPRFLDAFAVEHPDGLPGEIKTGKGGNITYAGRELQKYLERKHIDPVRVVVTTLDADNHPDKNYLNALTYAYTAAPDPIHASYQPVAMYTNNIWDAPAPMRVLATGNSLFNLVVSLRLHALRNFSAHAQPMAALIQTDFWSSRTVVEDGHQFWRSYFAFNGRYRVLPLHVPICQDAVLAEGYRKTIRAQFLQLRRWTYGASDVAYVAHNAFFRHSGRAIPLWDRWSKFWRLLEGHVTWAVGPLLVLFSGFVPSMFNHQSIAAYELPLIVSRIQTVGILALVITVFMALRTLPPKPARYRHHRTAFMVLQWVYFPLTTLLFNCMAAFNSQTRLIFKRYLTTFDITEKAVVVGQGRSKQYKA